MASIDTVAARREARRRRILENSQNRLHLIAGKHSNDYLGEQSIKPVDPDINSEPCVFEHRSTNPIPNGVISETISTFEPLHSFNATQEYHDPHEDVTIPNELAALLASATEPPRTPVLWDKIMKYKHDVVILSLVIQILHSLSVVTFDNVYFFLPLIMYTITKSIFFPSQSKSKIASLVLLLNNVSRDTTQKLINLMQWGSLLSQDMCVYLFITICTQSLYHSIKDMFVT